MPSSPPPESQTMNITPIKKNGYLLLQVEGRLDAAWSEHFYNCVASSIREGMHDIRIDAEKLEYLSSAGIRVLIRAHRELKSVNGSFAIVRASDFVVQTLSMSGFDTLLALETDAEKVVENPAAPKAAGSGKEEPEPAWKLPCVNYELFELDPEASMEIRDIGAWKPWQAIDPEKCPRLVLGRDTIAVGTGAPGANFGEAQSRMGDFAAAAGCVTWQPGSGGELPDYIIQEGRLVPELICANALLATGAFSHLFRFNPKENSGDNSEHGKSAASATLSITSLLNAAAAITKSQCTVFVALAEVDGLVGMSTNRSPGLIKHGSEPKGYPEVCEWTSFCGERVHEGMQAFIVGFADATDGAKKRVNMPALPSRDGMKAHVHAAVFPFHPLANGKIYMADSVAQVFSGGGPIGMLHLVEDHRPALGLGQSTLRRGAVWCAPAHFISLEDDAK
jgi:anti-anti-sigma factor